MIHVIQIWLKFEAEKTEPPIRTVSENSIHKAKYDKIYIVESNTSNSLLLDIISNDYVKIKRFFNNPSDADIHRDSCSVSHKGKLYFYGGSNHPNKISKFDCDDSETRTRIKFNFVGRTCESNNNYILLCFPVENNRLCYKTKSPLPKKWWQLFTYVELSYATHDSIALSSGSTSDRFLGLKLKV